MKQLTDEQILKAMRDCHDGVAYTQDNVHGPRAIKLNEGRAAIAADRALNGIGEAKPAKESRLLVTARQVLTDMHSQDVLFEWWGPLEHAIRAEEAAQPAADDKAVEPVAKVMQHDHGGLKENNLIDTDLPCGTLLYATPPTPAVPDDWQLVPVEPTEEMIEAGKDVKRRRLLASVKAVQSGGDPDELMGKTAGAEYRAMLAAAPKP